MTLNADNAGRDFTAPASLLAGPAILTERLIREYLITEYVLTPDDYASSGLIALLSQQGKTGVLLADDKPLHAPWALHMHDYWRLTVVIPPDPLTLLEMTRRIAGLVQHSSRPPRLLILSPVPAGWLMRTLKALACPASMLSEVIVLPGRTDCATLAALLSGKPGGVPTDELQPDTGSRYPVLTPTEFRAVSDWLAGLPAKACAARNGGSVKTVYLHRHHGRCKLGQLFPQLLPRSAWPDSGA